MRGTAQCLHREPRPPRAGLQPGAEALQQKTLPPWSLRVRVRALQTQRRNNKNKHSTNQPKSIGPDATRTANKLNLLYLALIRLLLHALRAFREPVRLGGVRLPALVDLRDGA